MHRGVQPAVSHLSVGECSAGVLCSVWSTALQHNTATLEVERRAVKMTRDPEDVPQGKKNERFTFAVPKEEPSAGKRVGDRQFFKHR